MMDVRADAESRPTTALHLAPVGSLSGGFASQGFASPPARDYRAGKPAPTEIGCQPIAYAIELKHVVPHRCSQPPPPRLCASGWPAKTCSWSGLVAGSRRVRRDSRDTARRSRPSWSSSSARVAMIAATARPVGVAGVAADWVFTDKLSGSVRTARPCACRPAGAQFEVVEWIAQRFRPWAISSDVRPPRDPKIGVILGQAC